MSMERLDKLLSDRTDLSRVEAKKAIRAGRVQVAGRVLRTPDIRVNPALRITLDNKALRDSSALYILLNKPTGLLTAARDSRAPTVMNLLPPYFVKIKCMPVGRLDKDTSGLLLLMTDGELAHRLLSPKRGIEKVYEAQVAGQLDAEDVQAFQEGIALSDFTAQPSQLRILQADAEASTAQVSLMEGKHRQVRRMLGSRGHEVLSLKRLKFGPIVLEDPLPPGAYRELTDDEVQALKEAVNLV
ncbi:MAG: rRNA pseudouridine synthase [Clostridiales bacterium]|nr:rRNA pseudouridine synthase [Clostridiales bacterium]